MEDNVITANSRFHVSREHSNECNSCGGCAESELGRGRGRSSSVTDGRTHLGLFRGRVSWWTLLMSVLSHISRISGKGNGNPLQYSCLENPVDRGAWWAAVHGVAQSRTWLKRLSLHACIGEGNGNPLQYSCLEDPRDRGACWASMESQRVGHYWSDLAAAAAG